VHVAKITQLKHAQIIFFGKPGVQSPLEKRADTGHRIILKLVWNTYKGVNWIQEAQDRVTCRDFAYGDEVW
jgi:GTPase Era involved in 16S rRNA processing